MVGFTKPSVSWLRVFTLRRMAERWVTNAPFGNWSDYADALARYTDDLLAHDKRQLPAGMTLGEWLALHENRLRSDRYQRDANATAAYALLPAFESAPGGWNAVRLLPNSTETLTDYIRHWHSAVPDADQPFVLRILRSILVPWNALERPFISSRPRRLDLGQFKSVRSHHTRRVLEKMRKSPMWICTSCAVVPSLCAGGRLRRIN